LYKENEHSLDALLSTFQGRWAGILSIPADVRRVRYTTEELRPRVRTAFEASQPGWSFTRCHTPDVLIAASDVHAVRRGDYQLVMGELHMGKNTLAASLFASQHPSLDKVLYDLALEQPEPRVVPIVPKHWPELTARTLPVFVLPYDFRLALTHDSFDSPEWQTLLVGDLVVEAMDDELVVRTRDGRLCFDIVQVIADLIANHVVNNFKLLPPAPHTPRVTIDRLVVCRETWRFPVEELAFALEKEEANRFLAARRWMRQHDLPRFVFAKTPIERKPFYVDFDSPILVNILAKYVRRTGEQGADDAQITVTEMLPDPSHVWLPDAQGRHYTSELRIVAVDLEAITPGR